MKLTANSPLNKHIEVPGMVGFLGIWEDFQGKGIREGFVSINVN